MTLVRAMTAGDWPDVQRIWTEGIATRNATFEPAPPSWAAFDAGRPPHLRLVALLDGTVVGWAAAGPVSNRPVYAGVAEHSVYVGAGAQGRGVGRVLLEGLIRAGESTGVWTLRSGIFPENEASLRLHDACGFRRAALLERVGYHHGQWRDVVAVERRSRAVGGDEPLVRLARPAGARADAPGGHDGGDLAAVRALLAASGLDDVGLDDAWRVWVADAEAIGGRIVGCVALERYADSYLLRSLAVGPAHRGTGLGARLVTAALTGADLEAGHPATACLLTETAAGYFDRFGFAEVTRADLPAAVAPSAQLTGACPASARVYLRAGGRDLRHE